MIFTDDDRTLDIRIVDTAPHGADLTDAILGGMGVSDGGGVRWAPDLNRILDRAFAALDDPERVLRATWALADDTGPLVNGWRQTGGDHRVVTRTRTYGSIGGHRYMRPADDTDWRG